MNKQLMMILVSLSIPNAFAGEVKPERASHVVKMNELEIDIVQQAPHLMVAPLQVFGVFLYEEKNDGFSGADLEMDEGFNGAIQEIRKKSHFGSLAENLVLIPRAGQKVAPARVLLMGLGRVKDFKASDMEQVGVADIRAACALGLTEFSHASDVQDGGVSRINAGDIAEHVAIGLVRELRLQKALAEKGLVPPCHVAKVAYLAGPKFMKDTVSSLDKIAKKLNASGNL